MRVVEPGGDWHSVVGMEDVRGRGIVEDNGIRHRPAKL